MIASSPLVMECRVDDVYETEGFESFICKIDHTYAEEDILNEKGKIDYSELKPVLFEMPTYEYLATGEVPGKLLKFQVLCYTNHSELRSFRFAQLIYNK